VDDLTLFCVRKDKISDIFRQITSQDNLCTVGEEKIGISSIRELLVTFVRRNGCSHDAVDAGGRWDSNRRMVDTNADRCIPSLDEK